MKKYSIILPVRNGGEYVKECVNSILAQTHDDFDLIVLDNCSTDGTPEWIASLKNNKIKLLFAPSPLSMEESWARATSIEKNEFITILGHDDILYPNFLQTIDLLVHQHPSASLYLTHFDLIDAEGKMIRACKPMQATYTGDELLKGILSNTVDIMGTGYVMRSKDYDGVGGIPVKYPRLLYADFELWVNLASKGYEVIAPEKCFAFRMHQSTAHSSKDSSLHDAMDIWIDCLAELKQKNEKTRAVVDEYGNEFLLFYCKGFSHRLLRTGIEDREGMTVEKMIGQTKQWAKKIGLESRYHPEKIFSIRLAGIIDNSAILRKVFLLFKKVYPKSVIKK